MAYVWGFIPLAQFWADAQFMVVCRTLQGNWFEDRIQSTVGSNDGLRCATIAYDDMMRHQVAVRIGHT